MGNGLLTWAKGFWVWIIGSIEKGYGLKANGLCREIGMGINKKTTQY